MDPTLHYVRYFPTLISVRIKATELLRCDVFLPAFSASVAIAGPLIGAPGFVVIPIQ